MTFVDYTTPTNNEYQQATANYNNPNGSKHGNETTRQRANDWATMYYQNAYNTAVMNYMNEYNSPQQQMLRYMDAGINPYLAGQDPGNMSSAPSGGAPKGSSDRGPTTMEMIGAALQGVNTVSTVLKSAQGIYDYIKYGRDLSQTNLMIARNNLAKYQSEADWSMYWNYGPGFGPNSVYVEGSPRANYMNESTNRITAQIGQLEALVNVLYPSQASANEARAAIINLQREILDGQKGAVLKIDTGNDIADSVLQMIAYWLLNK